MRRKFSRKPVMKVCLYLPTEIYEELDKIAKNRGLCVGSLSEKVLTEMLPRIPRGGCAFLGEFPENYPKELADAGGRGACRAPENEGHPCYWPKSIESRCHYFREKVEDPEQGP
jgi:hypothetical protein